MINISFCFEHDSDLFFIEKEISTCFQQRGVDVSTNCSHNANELKENTQNFCPDILFCDFKDKTSTLCKTVLSIKNHNPELVSIIVNGNYIISDKEQLLQPVFLITDKSRKQLWSYASLAYEAVFKSKDSFTYYHRPSYNNTPVNDILYFASEGRRTFLFSNDGCDTFYKKLDDVEQLVENKSCQFLRIHKSYLVNVNYISSYSRNYVKLLNGERLRISNYYHYKKINETLNMQPTH